jgi:hypothetical protein
MGMCCKGKNKQGQYRPWEYVVKVKTNKAIQDMGMCYKGRNKQGQYRTWECVVKVKTNEGNTDRGNVL